MHTVEPAQETLTVLALTPGAFGEELFAATESTARSAISQPEFEQLWEEEREMEFDEAVALAIARTSYAPEDRDHVGSPASLPRR